MRVQKIIRTHPDLFNLDPNKQYSDHEAIQMIASMDCDGDKNQQKDFSIRQTYSAIRNLLSLGFRTTAVELAIDLIPKAEEAQNYTLAQDLCGQLIAHFYQTKDMESVHRYKSLYAIFTLNITNEYNSMLLFGAAIYNHQKVKHIDADEVNTLIQLIGQNLSADPLWYRYYYYQFQSFLKEDKNLKEVLLKAIEYFENLHLNHEFFLHPFYERLINYYLEHEDLQNAELLLNRIEPGTLPWFKNHLYFVKTLLERNDIKSNDICILIMNHPNFINLSEDLIEEWKAVYKSSVRLLLDH
jgi:hypothetical protein